MKKILSFTVCICSVIMWTSCSSSAYLRITENTDYVLSADFVPGAILENNIARLIQKNKTDSIFNQHEVKKSLTAKGITVNAITLKGLTGLTLSCTVPRTHKLPAQCIRYDQEQKHIQVRISPENIHDFLDMMPAESRDFIDMLGAPLFTGEAIPTAEYEAFIAAAYGKKIAAELQSSFFTLTIDTPYAIQNAHIMPIGTVKPDSGSSTRAVIVIPLIELFCIRVPVEIELQGN